jgi:hypothetical protein
MAAPRRMSSDDRALRFRAQHERRMQHKRMLASNMYSIRNRRMPHGANVALAELRLAAPFRAVERTDAEVRRLLRQARAQLSRKLGKP